MRLTVGTAAAAGLASRFGLSFAQDAAAGAKAKSMILLWMAGAPSQIDTFDPKPGRPTGGPFKAIETNARGIEISEHFPRLARQANRFSLVRTLQSRDPNHETAIYMLHTGYRREPTVERPNLGCLVARELAPRDFDLPAYVCVGNPVAPGILGPQYAGFRIEKIDDPLENVILPPGVDRDRAKAREKLLAAQQKEFKRGRTEPALDDHLASYENALRLVHSSKLGAFDLSKEPDPTRKAYGDTPFGKGCLMARRLVESGVKFVEVQLGDWDTHENNFERTRGLMEQVDPAFSSLLSDLADRKLLEETLVVWMGEFGRTPQINDNKGRDHFTKAWSVALAGGGIQGGRGVGRTDVDGLDVAERPVSIPELFATFTTQLGIDGEKKLVTPEGRPVKILEDGSPILELL